MTQAEFRDQVSELATKVASDVAGGLSTILVRVGEQTGLFASLADGESTSQELANRADLAERYVREWASAMAAAGYISYDPSSTRFFLNPAQALVFANAKAPCYAPPFAELLVAVAHDEGKLTQAFRTGEGIAWGDHHGCLFCSTERLTSQIVLPELVGKWLGQVEGGGERLGAGVRIADIGCGRGAAVIAMAKAFPAAFVHGFDLHAPSIDHARASAREAGVDNAQFTAGAAETVAEGGFDIAVIIDALHDMGDPVAVAANVRTLLKPGGHFLVIEPFAEDRLEDNLTLSGKFGYAASTCICTPVSLSQEGRAALGAQAGFARLRAVLEQAGFSKIRAIRNEPRHIVIEAGV